MARKPNNSKYNKKKHCEDIVSHMSEGYSIASWCKKQGIARTTYDNWKDNHPDFERATKLAKAGAQGWWEDVGRAMALKGNAAAFIFQMKNRFGYTDKQKLDVQQLQPKILEPFDKDEKPIKLVYSQVEDKK